MDMYPMRPARVVVAIPVHNEAAVIADCLQALASQTCLVPFEVVLLLNNCTDATAAIVETLAPSLSFTLHVQIVWLEPDRLNAGVARRLAMQHAAGLAGLDGILLTTDADSRVPPDWLEANLACLRHGADAVAGMALLDPEDERRLPAHLILDEARVVAFATLLDEIDWLVDPAACDPWPRHTEHSGASIAVKASLLAQIGGVPNVALGEDRALFAELRRVDARIRHAREVTVTVSGRTVGRAKGGMADTIAIRILQPDQWLDETFETGEKRRLRATLRRAMREAWRRNAPELADAVAAGLGLAPDVVQASLQSPLFGTAWVELECLSPALQIAPIPTSRLEEEIEAAAQVVQALRGVNAPAGPADSVVFGWSGETTDLVLPGE